MSVNSIFSQTIVTVLMPSFRLRENFVLLHIISEVPGYGRR